MYVITHAESAWREQQPFWVLFPRAFHQKCDYYWNSHKISFKGDFKIRFLNFLYMNLTIHWDLAGSTGLKGWRMFFLEKWEPHHRTSNVTTFSSSGVQIFQMLHDTWDSNYCDKEKLELTKYFRPYRYVDFAQNTFRQARQKVGESHD